MECPACSSKKSTTLHSGVEECSACGAVYGRCYLGTSYEFVLPYWDDAPNCPEQKYFDFECLGSEGLTRRHGWFNPETKKITQTG